MMSLGFNRLRMNPPICCVRLLVIAYHNELPCGVSEPYSRRWLGQQEAEIASFSCRTEASCSYL